MALRSSGTDAQFLRNMHSDTSNENNSSSEESGNTPVEDTEITEEPEENQETPDYWLPCPLHPPEEPVVFLYAYTTV